MATSAEAGLTDFTFAAWIGLFGPRGLPPEIVARVQAALDTTLADAATRGRMTAQGDEPGGGTTAALAALVRADHARWGKVVKDNGITAAS